MAQFQTHTIETAPADSKEILTAVNKKLGFIPNMLGKLAEAPTAVKAYLSLADIYGETSFTPTEREVVAMTSSFENECHYCMAAHSTAAKGAGVPGDVIEALRSGEKLADNKLEALRTFARKVVTRRGWVEDADVQAFKNAGYTNAQSLEVIVGVALKTISNYSNHLLDTPVDGPFKTQTWEPPVKAGV